MKRCKIKGCDRKRYVRGWCTLHYQRWRAHGDPNITLRKEKRECKVEGCTRVDIIGHDYCSLHYQKWRTYGDPLHATYRPRDMNLRKVVQWIIEQSSTTDSGCLEYTRSTSRAGYGQVRFNGKLRICTRLILEHKIGRKLRKDELACHKCHNPKCVNVKHLYVGNAKTNSYDRALSTGYNLAKLDEMDVFCIRALSKRTNLPARVINKKFDVSVATIKRIIKGETYKHVK